VFGSAESKARAYLSLAGKTEGNESLQYLQMILDLDIEAGKSPKTDHMLATTYSKLADRYTAPTRQLYFLQRALEVEPDPATREKLELRVNQAAAGRTIDLARNTTVPSGFTPQDFGPDQSCAGANPAGIPSLTLMSIADPIGPLEDRNFVSIDVPLITQSSPFRPDTGYLVRIETTSDFCDSEASCSDNAFDTDLVGLWAMCDNGFADRRVARDVTGDSGLGWLSMMETECLDAGTYYIEVMGQFGNAPKNFNVEVTQIGTCDVPKADWFEIDDSIDTAKRIGHKNSLPDNSLGWFGRFNKDIQSKTIMPLGEMDHTLHILNRNEQLRVDTAIVMLTWQNGFAFQPAGPFEDTQMTLFYEIDPSGGICNSGSGSTSNSCFSYDLFGIDERCSPEQPVKFAGFDPQACMPMALFAFANGVRFDLDNPIAYNDDKDAATGDFGSRIQLCLPKTGINNLEAPSLLAGFVARVDETDLVPIEQKFFYETRAWTMNECTTMEAEPNNDPFTANPIAADGAEVFGFWDRAFYRVNFAGATDFDYWGPFDVEDLETDVVYQKQTLLKHPDLPNNLALIVGPDDDGFWYVVDDASSTSTIVELDIVIPPANDYLGNTVADAHYYLDTGGPAGFTYPNYYYSLKTKIRGGAIEEIEPNDICDTTPHVLEGPDAKFVGTVTPGCDVDAVKFPVLENTNLTLATQSPGVDSMIKLYDCNGGPILNACDDDSNPSPGNDWTSILSGCVPPGEYCIRVSSYNFGDQGDTPYELTISGAPGCTPASPPDMGGDMANACANFEDCD